MAQDYPNILYLHSHDTGRYVEPYGYPVPTPQIQKLAEQGVMFRQAYCAAPMCSASRASLLLQRQTGKLSIACRLLIYPILQRPGKTWQPLKPAPGPWTGA